MSARRLATRGLLLVVYLGLAALAMFVGRGHTLLLQNGPAFRSTNVGDSTAIGNSTVAGGPALKVTIDGAPAVEIGPSEARAVEVRGGRHRLRIEYPDGRPALAKEVRIPFGLDRATVDVSAGASD